MNGYKSFTSVNQEVILAKSARVGQVVMVGESLSGNGGQMAVVDFQSGSGSEAGIYFKSFNSGRRLKKIGTTVTVIGKNPTKEVPEWAKKFQ
jgi:hypothetical protein